MLDSYLKTAHFQTREHMNLAYTGFSIMIYFCAIVTQNVILFEGLMLK